MVAAKGAYKTAKAAEKAGKTATLVARGARAGKSITRFAALCRKTGKLKNVSKIIYKVGKIVQKHPRLSGFLVKRLISRREDYSGKLSMYKSAKAVYKGGETKKSLRISKRLDRIKKKKAA